MFPDDEVSLGWVSLGRADLPRALERFGRAIQRNPKKYGYLRFVRASAFQNTAQHDSAAAEISALLAQLRASDEKALGTGYQSKELLEYALGLLHLQALRRPAARETFGRAVVENAAFSPAHAMLGRLAVEARDSATALLEYGLAVETDPGNVDFRIGYGNALTFAHRQADAATQFSKAMEIEPLYAEPYYLLAVALEAMGKNAGAGMRYGQFLDHATRSDPRRATAEAKRSLK